jgi:hypothetical protein
MIDMEHYVTLFDKNYLPQGLLLHRSMERHIKKYQLWILCVDEETYQILTSLELHNVRLLNLKDVETDELREIKKQRSKGEYCWTLTPYSLRFVLEADKSIKRVTYIDADVWFLAEPSMIFDEFIKSGKHVLITEHAFSPEHDQSKLAGKYCVQFMTFDRFSGEVVRSWWERKCKEWCYARYEDGRFGDQKYLDTWPDLFKNEVHVLEKKELLLAPWNAQRFPYSDAVLWHFHGLKVISENKTFIGVYEIPTPVINNIYLPYIKEMKLVNKILSDSGWKFESQIAQPRFYGQLMLVIKNIYKLMRSLNTKNIIYQK